MTTLIRYELKKLFHNRAGIAACALVLLLLVCMSALNLATTGTRDRTTGESVQGAAALESIRSLEESHAGALDDERVRADLAEYDRANRTWYADPELNGMSSQDIIDSRGLAFWQETLAIIQDSYYLRLAIAMTIDADGNRASGLQEAHTAWFSCELQGSYLGYFPYSEEERAYWRAKADEVAWPIEYGYAGGWDSLLSWMSFFGLAIIAACIAVSGAFAFEYQSGTAAVALPTLRGKRGSPAAKVIAALLFTTVYWWLCVGTMVAIYLGVRSTDGADLPIQVFDFLNPYALTAGQSVALLFLMGYIVALGCVGFTLLLSSKLRSMMPVAVIPMAIVFFGVVAKLITPLAKVASLTPMNALNDSFVAMISYSVGPLVADLPTAAVVLYSAIALVCIPLSTRVFARHQISQ